MLNTAIRLRPHHLLCLLTYTGKGYSRAFTANFDLIAERIGAGADIVLVTGPDDICAPRLSDDDCHCFRKSITERDEHAAEALAKLLSRPIGPGTRMRLPPQMLVHMRQAFASGETRRACAKCEWASLCTSIAADGYEQTRLAAKYRP